MLNRRTFLLTSLATTAGILSGCSSSQNTLDVTLLQNSIPPQLIGDFQKFIAKTGQIKLQAETDLKIIFEALQAGKQTDEAAKPSMIDSLPIVGKNGIQQANVVTLGDYWLQTAIADNLIQPLDVSELQTWSSLSNVWQKLVKRDRDGYLNSQGSIYGAPYRWGNTVIAYRKDKIAWTPTDWSDLWREELKRRISLLDDDREVIGLTLKKLGHSYNTQDLSQVANLTTELETLQQQVKFYSSDKYLQPLVLGDTWLAVGWSTDILAITKRYSNIGVVVPASGTSLWADVWVKPNLGNLNASNEKIVSLLTNWIDFCWQSKSAKQILLFTNGISPVLTNSQDKIRQDLASDLAKNPVLEASLASFDKSEFLFPLSSETTTAYQNLWKKMRQTG